jgi:cation transport ATPase
MADSRIPTYGIVVVSEISEMDDSMLMGEGNLPTNPLGSRVILASLDYQGVLFIRLTH